LLLPTCVLPGGVSPVGDIALRTPADAKVCLGTPPSARGLRTRPDGRAAGACGAWGPAKTDAAIKPVARAKRSKCSPGLRAPRAGSPPVSALAAAARWSCFFFLFFCSRFSFLLNFFPFDDIGSAIFPLSSDLLQACEKASGTSEHAQHSRRSGHHDLDAQQAPNTAVHTSKHQVHVT
jgi:hypothetical protein